MIKKRNALLVATTALGLSMSASAFYGCGGGGISPCDTGATNAGGSWCQDSGGLQATDGSGVATSTHVAQGSCNWLT
jgi:hypothetical protein